MKCRLWSLLWLFPLLISPAAYTQNRIAIPSYQDPGSAQWNAWSAVGSASVGIMIVNENNGDDTSKQPAIAQAIRDARRSGIFVVGYVYTGYGKRDPAVVRNRVDAVFKNYLVDGIFFDETPTDCLAANPNGGTNYSYYQKLSEYIRAKQVGGRLVILNPGTQPANDCWMSIANILVTAESSSLADYTANYVDQPWFHQYGPSRFWHIVYNASGVDQLKQLFTLSQERGAGWLYVTNQGNNGGNPYAGPPAYWRAEAGLVANEAIQAPYATARVDSTDEQGNAVPAKMSFRWKALRGTHWRIEIANAAERNSATDFDANERIEVEADGAVDVSVSSDGGWHPADRHAVAFNLNARTHLVELDSRGLNSAVKFRIRAYDGSGNALSTTSAIPLSLTNRDYSSDIQDH